MDFGLIPSPPLRCSQGNRESKLREKREFMLRTLTPTRHQASSSWRNI